MYPYQAPPLSEPHDQGRTTGTKTEPPQRYAAPHPNMFPIPPPQGLLPFPTQPMLPQMYSTYPALPTGARVLSPPRFPTADELKYKCSICGRTRSPRYHYRHPIPPGELPRATICRRCRQEATDSEASEEERVPRARSRSVVQRVRSLSREYEEVLPRRQRMRSSSRSGDIRRVRVVEERRRPRSPDVQVVRYVEPRQRRSAMETTYVEDDRSYRRSGSSYEDDLYIVSDDEYDCPPRARMLSRAPTPMHRIKRYQASDPPLVERREFYDGPNSVIEERTLVRASRPVSRGSSRSTRLVHVVPRRPRIVREESQSEEEVYTRPAARRPVFEEEDWYANRRGRSRSRQERSRSRVSVYSHDADEHARQPHMARAPSPPRMGGSSLGYIEPGGHDDGPPARSARRHSRARSVVQDASTFLRPGDNITVIERNSGDYDTYDRDGMRVRIREI